MLKYLPVDEFSQVITFSWNSPTKCDCRHTGLTYL